MYTLHTHTYAINMYMDTKLNTYTQREWDRVVGWGTVPKEYQASHEVDSRQKSREAVDADFDKREAFSQKI